MILDELVRLERFRRMATIHGISLPEKSMLPFQEVEYLRGFINANVYLRAEAWMCPSWVNLSRKSIDKEKEFATEFHNTLYRNWSDIGGVGAKRFGIICSRGLVVPRFDFGSIDFWPLDNDELMFPALIGKDGPQMKLVSTEDQLYEWKVQIKSVEFVRLVYHIMKDNSEYVYNEIILRNLGLEKATCSFCIVVRPMSPLGVEPIETIEYDSSRQTLFVNDNLALMVNKKPTAIVMCEGNDPDLPKTVIEMSTQSDIRLKSKTGLATAVLRFNVTLSPAGTERIILGSPLFAATKNDDIPTFNPNDNDRDKSVGRWFDFADERTAVTFPDSRLDSVFNQATLSLAIQALPVIFPDGSHLESLNWKERIRVLLALIRSGSTKATEHVVAEIVSKIVVPKGPLELSTFSPLLLGILQYYEHTTDIQISRNYLEYFRQCTSGVVDAIQKLMGTGEISIDAASIIVDDQPLEHYPIIKEGIISDFENQLWNLAALKAARTFFEDMHDKEFTTTLEQTIAKYQDFVIEKSKEIQHARWIRPTDPVMQRIEREILDVLASVVLLRVTEIEPSILELVHSKIAKHRIVNNLWKFFQPNERYSSHLALRLAHFYVKTKRRNLVEPLLNRVLDFFTDDYHLPDFVDIRTYGGSGGSGQSVTAAADLILLLLDMVLYEEASNLIILAGVPEAWFTTKKPLIVDSLPTLRGKAHIELGSSSNQHQIEIRLVDLPEEIEIHVPSSIPIPMVKAYGASIVERVSNVASPFLKLVPLSEETVLTYHK
ncbi:MAG: hypothetical protein E4H14_05580 [Candidatus Thorarchaeota archaeon]|nr:MAG: hypothetical protein E4H14_05580 [Candidatus Thorarchaeota archaeon]